MFLMKCICLFVSLTGIVYSILQPSDVLNTQHIKRNKRLIDFNNLEEISIKEHEQKYPFIVGIKTVQKRRFKKVRIRCTGTMLNPHLVLTAGHCVSNSSIIVVFKHDNFLDRKENKKGVYVEIRQNLTYLNNFTDPDGVQRFPNPLFYGYIIDKEHKWINIDPMEESGRFPLRNLAIIYLETPLYPYDSKIKYPVIDMNPAHFTRKYVDADMFGWCQYENGTIGEKPKSEPRLTKVAIKVTYCEDLNGLKSNNNSPGLLSTTFLLCTDRKFNDGRYCDLDHGGPVIVWGSKATETSPVTTYKPTTLDSSGNRKIRNSSNESPPEFEPQIDVPWSEQSSATLIAIINKPRWYGSTKTSPESEQLLYLWQYADWIHSVMDEFLATPTPMSPCVTREIVVTTSATDMDAAAKRLHIESYYDFEGLVDSSQVSSGDESCESTDSPAATRRPSAVICALVLAAAAAVSSK